jgi:hypothetical protein
MPMPPGHFGLAKVFSVFSPPHNAGNVDAANRGLENVAARWNIFVILLSCSFSAWGIDNSKIPPAKMSFR